MFICVYIYYMSIETPATQEYYFLVEGYYPMTTKYRRNYLYIYVSLQEKIYSHSLQSP